MTLSVVIPVRRDIRAGESIAQLRSWAANRGIATEIIVCGELLPAQSIEGAMVLPVVPALKGRCVREEVLASTGSVVLICDADLPVSVRALDSLIAGLVEADVAAARRLEYTSGTAARRVASTVFRSLARVLAGLPKDADPQCGVKAFRVGAARLLFARQLISGLAYEVEVMRRARDTGLRIIHVPVQWRSDSTTICLWREAPRMLLDLLRFSIMMWHG